MFPEEALAKNYTTCFNFEMSSIDQFESQFKAATKEIFHFSEINIRKVLVVSDLPLEEVKKLMEILKKFLSTLHQLS